MGMNESFEVASRIEKGLKLNPSREATPKQVINSIQPVFIINTPLPLLREITDIALNDSAKTITVPENKTWRILYGNFVLVTTATAGNRIIRVDILNNSGSVLYTTFAANVQVASTTEDYSLGRFATAAEPRAGSHELPIPGDLFLPAGFQISIKDEAAIAAAADDLTIHLLVEEYDYSMF